MLSNSGGHVYKGLEAVWEVVNQVPLWVIKDVDSIILKTPFGRSFELFRKFGSINISLGVRIHELPFGAGIPFACSPEKPINIIRAD